MIKTNNPEMDAVIETLQAQRNEAMDAVALLQSQLKTQEGVAAALQKQLNELTKAETEKKE